MAVTVITLIYTVLIKIYFNPKESLLWVKRRMNKEESQTTESAIRYTKLASSISMIVITLMLIITFMLTKVEILMHTK